MFFHSPPWLYRLSFSMSVRPPFSFNKQQFNYPHNHGITSTPTPHTSLLPNVKLIKCNCAIKVFDETSQPKSLIQDASVPHRLSLIHDLGHITHQEKIKLGTEYHALIIKTGVIHDKYVVTSLLTMYAKCGDVESAGKLFHRLSDLDIVTYNSFISGYANNGMLDQALDIFMQAQTVSIMPNGYTFSILLSVCGTVQEGKQLHGCIVKMQYLNNTAVGNALLTMYSKCGMVEEFENFFQQLPSKNHISWTAYITGMHYQEQFEKALEKFNCMRKSGVVPNERTYAIAFASCGGMGGVLEYGRMYHAQSIKNGTNLGVFVGTAIVDMYSGCGDMGDAEKQFEEIGIAASEVLWNALLAGYIRNDMNEEAMGAFSKMVRGGFKCDHFTYSNVLKCCSSLPSLASGEQIHCQVIKRNYLLNMHVGSSLIEMYANSGSLAEAEFIFNEMPLHDIVSWNSIVKAHSLNGSSKKVFALFAMMIHEGIKPTGATFLAILSCCSHSGLVHEGKEFFKTMVRDYKISPEEKHYSSIVDLLGRSGQLKNARHFINNLPIEPSASIWRPLLAACRSHNNLQMAEFIASRILDIEPSDATVYVTLSNMYAEAGRWEEALKQRELMEVIKVKKEPGCSWIEVDNKQYKFYSSDMTHTEMPEIYERLDILMKEIKNLGYVAEQG